MGNRLDPEVPFIREQVLDTVFIGGRRQAVIVGYYEDEPECRVEIGDPLKPPTCRVTIADLEHYIEICKAVNKLRSV